MAYIRHYFPGVNLEHISDEDFAMLSEEAIWLHQQMTMSRLTTNFLTTQNPSLILASKSL